MLKITQVLQANVKIIVRKTGKTHHRSRSYAKHVIKGRLKEPKEHEFFLRENRGWRKVTEEEFKEATSKENVKKVHEKLREELQKRVEREMEG